MLYTIVRIAIFLGIGLAIYLGIRRIWRDWKGEFKAVDKAKLERDRAERDKMKRGDGMITLKRDKDGTFRPGDDPDTR